MEIKIKPKRGLGYFHRLCSVCGDLTDRTRVYMRFVEPFVDPSAEPSNEDGAENCAGNEIVCESCIARGPEAMKEALLLRAEELRRYAEDFLSRIAEADFVVPTAEEIDRARYESDERGSWCMSFAEYMAKHGFEKWKKQFLAREASPEASPEPTLPSLETYFRGN